MVTKENVMQILECSDVYAQKMIDWCSGNQAAAHQVNSMTS
ncbi:hypothetical protein [Staphylococcus epidermidis]|nr:hypothetical protein [Staphylococcus epidermidis]